MKPYEMAWVSQGAPLIDDAALVLGVDIVTGEQCAGYPVKTVLGASFGDWRLLPHYNHPDAVVSRALRWALLAEAEKGSRVWLTKSFAWEIRRDGATMLGELYEKAEKKKDGRIAWGCRAWPDALYAALSTPVGGDRAVVVPDGGQIHVMPYTDWGHVGTDRWTGTWTQRDCDLLADMASLRGMGFGEKVLALPEPPIGLCLKIGIDPYSIRPLWRNLQVWRDNPQRFQIGIVATRQRKDSK